MSKKTKDKEWITVQEIAQQQIQKKLLEARALIKECEDLAIQYKTSFTWNIGVYGAGCSFDGEQVGQKDEYGDPETGWFASSQSC